MRLCIAGYETNNGHTTQTKAQGDSGTAPFPAHTVSGVRYTVSTDDEDKVQDPDGISGFPPGDNTPSESQREGSSDEKGEKELKRKEEDLGLEYRLSTSLLPLRCYLDSHFIYFLQDLGSRQQAIQEARMVQNGDVDAASRSSKPSDSREKRDREREKVKGGKVDLQDDSRERDRDRDGSQGPYFQHVWIAPVMLKIDYEPGAVECSTDAVKRIVMCAILCSVVQYSIEQCVL